MRQSNCPSCPGFASGRSSTSRVMMYRAIPKSASVAIVGRTSPLPPNDLGSNNKMVGTMPRHTNEINALTQSLCKSLVMTMRLDNCFNAGRAWVSTSDNAPEPGRATASARKISQRCACPPCGASHTNCFALATSPTARPARKPRSANDAARITPCSTVEFCPCPACALSFKSRTIHQSPLGVLSKCRTKSSSRRAEVSQ